MKRPFILLAALFALFVVTAAGLLTYSEIRTRQQVAGVSPAALGGRDVARLGGTDATGGGGTSAPGDVVGAEPGIAELGGVARHAGGEAQQAASADGPAGSEAVVAPEGGPAPLGASSPAAPGGGPDPDGGDVAGRQGPAEPALPTAGGQPARAAGQQGGPAPGDSGAAGAQGEQQAAAAGTATGSSAGFPSEGRTVAGGLENSVASEGAATAQGPVAPGLPGPEGQPGLAVGSEQAIGAARNVAPGTGGPGDRVSPIPPSQGQEGTEASAQTHETGSAAGPPLGPPESRVAGSAAAPGAAAGNGRQVAAVDSAGRTGADGAPGGAPEAGQQAGAADAGTAPLAPGGPEGADRHERSAADPAPAADAGRQNAGSAVGRPDGRDGVVPGGLVAPGTGHGLTPGKRTIAAGEQSQPGQNTGGSPTRGAQAGTAVPAPPGVPHSEGGLSVSTGSAEAPAAQDFENASPTTGGGVGRGLGAQPGQSGAGIAAGDARQGQPLDGIGLQPGSSGGQRNGEVAAAASSPLQADGLPAPGLATGRSGQAAGEDVGREASAESQIALAPPQSGPGADVAGGVSAQEPALGAEGVGTEPEGPDGQQNGAAARADSDLPGADGAAGQSGHGEIGTGALGQSAIVLEPVQAEAPIEADESIGAAVVALGPSTANAAPRIGSPPPGEAEPGFPPPVVSLEPLRSDQGVLDKGVEDVAGASVGAGGAIGTTAGDAPGPEVVEPTPGIGIVLESADPASLDADQAASPEGADTSQATSPGSEGDQADFGLPGSVPAVSPALALESVDPAALMPNGALVGEEDTGAVAQGAVSGAGGTESDLAVAGSVPAVSPTLAIEVLDAEPAVPEAPVEAMELAEVGAGGAPTTPPMRQDLAVRAAEVEAERLYVAGEAEPGTRVRVFADEQFVGEAEAGTEGNWLLEADKDVPVGEVMIRAETVEQEGNDVVAQAEIPFLRYADGIALEPVATAAEPEEGATDLEIEFPSVSYVIIRRGDNLWRISKRNYGRGLRYQAIFTANQDKIRDPDLIYPGQIFVVPTRDRNWERELSAKPN